MHRRAVMLIGLTFGQVPNLSRDSDIGFFQ